MPNGMALDVRAAQTAGAAPRRGGANADLCAVVMGLDQHRAQITAEWLDTATGGVGRARVAPGDRAGLRRFLARFEGGVLEVALEATTGWRFVVEELAAIGARAHLAEPAQTSALRGNKKRAKTDRADARHLRELLLAGRLPESWIPPDHLLDLRARVRLRHALVNQRGEWAQRIQAVLYHHGCPQRRQLMTEDGRAWLAAAAGDRTFRSQTSRSTRAEGVSPLPVRDRTGAVGRHRPARRL